MIEGSLRNVPLADVFQVIVTAQKSGILTLQRGRTRARVYFDQGRIQYAHISPGVHLGEVLVRLELLSVSEVLELLSRQQRENAGIPLGLAALSGGLLGADELRAAVERQVLEVLTELLGWRSGNFSFGESTSAAPRLPLEQNLDAMGLLMRVAQQLADYEEGSLDPTEVLRQAGDPTKVEMPANGWEVLAAVDGRRFAAAVAAELDLPERHVYQVLRTLKRIGVVETSPFPVEIPLVLLLTPSNTQQRLLRLLLLRSRVLPRLEQDTASALEFIVGNHVRAVIVDDVEGAAWQFVREVRKTPGRGHLPVVVLTGPGQEGGMLAKVRRPRALTLAKPFREHDFLQLLARMVGTPVG